MLPLETLQATSRPVGRSDRAAGRIRIYCTVINWRNILMRAKARLLGHPIHPMLIVFPLGLLTVAAIFDIIYVSTHNGHWADLSYWMIASGIVGGLIAAVFGVIDWFGIPGSRRARYIGLIPGVSNAVVVILFIVSWLTRRSNPTAPAPTALIL